MCLNPQFILADQDGRINFNVNKVPTKTSQPQPVSLFGCNYTRTNISLSWGKDNQVVSRIPYGNQKSASGKEYFARKYYMAAPPVPPKPAPDQKTNIGLMTPDRFTFKGEKAGQIVDLDYQILKPTYLSHVDVDYNYNSTKNSNSCRDLKVNYIPIDIHCPEFPWKNGAFGASGIGFFKDTDNQRRIFVPTLEKHGKSPLQCHATALDDIILDYEIFFETAEGKSKAVDLTEFMISKKTIPLICEPRAITDIPPGCRQN